MRLYEKMTSSNTALIVIDMVNSCAHERCEIPRWKISFKRIRKMAPRLVKFIGQFRQDIKVPIIFVKTTPWRKEFLTDNINELYTDKKAAYYSRDKSGFPEEFYLVSPEATDLVITKNHYDAFANTGLEKILKKKGIKYLIITGIFGDGCVLATICGGFSKGFNFVVIKDLIETTDVSVRQRLQSYLKKYTWPVMYGRTLTSEEFLKDWQENFPRDRGKNDGDI